ncbi:MAG: Hpt domain-containing protein, partial [Bacteroidales bacterium]|nr:Hpt domain-containing protein [Bacteroidales bacterium]
MIDEFTKRFIEEATDNINELENALLELDKSPGDNQIIERIFRSLHSLKGGGAMFGFETVSNITHELENIYDNIRSGKQKISDPITSLTLEIVDHLRNLLVDPTLKDENIRQMQAYFEHKITELNTSGNEQQASSSEKTTTEEKKSK